MNGDRSIAAVMADLVGEVGALLRSEIRLAQTEISEKMSRARSGLVLAIAGALLLTPAFVILLVSASLGLSIGTGISLAAATAAVGGFVFILGLILAFIGARRLRTRDLAPHRTVNQLERDAAMARREMHAT